MLSDLTPKPNVKGGVQYVSNITDILHVPSHPVLHINVFLFFVDQLYPKKSCFSESRFQQKRKLSEERNEASWWGWMGTRPGRWRRTEYNDIDMLKRRDETHHFVCKLRIKENLDTCYNIKDLWRHYAKWEGGRTKKQYRFCEFPREGEERRRIPMEGKVSTEWRQRFRRSDVLLQWGCSHCHSSIIHLKWLRESMLCICHYNFSFYFIHLYFRDRVLLCCPWVLRTQVCTTTPALGYKRYIWL